MKNFERIKRFYALFKQNDYIDYVDYIYYMVKIDSLDYVDYTDYTALQQHTVYMSIQCTVKSV